MFRVWRVKGAITRLLPGWSPSYYIEVQPGSYIFGLASPLTHTRSKSSPILLYSGEIVEEVHDPNGLFLLKRLSILGSRL
jgi:hypothetical protein